MLPPPASNIEQMYAYLTANSFINFWIVHCSYADVVESIGWTCCVHRLN